LGTATVVLTVVGVVLERPMEHAGGPSILAFEFAATKARVGQILAEWGPSGRRAARIGLIVDYAYMVSYGGFFTLAGLATRDLAIRQDWRRLATAGRVVPFFAVAAACFDAIENVFLLIALAGHGGNTAPLLATVCSSIKWVLITLAIIYAICGAVGWLRRTPRHA
jgi:hypothetical protein